MSSGNKTRGFTLIELSIVLVIIGLIVGGVLVGQDLIRAAEMRNILGDSTRFITAANTYRLKYNAKPGDHNSAETFFGAGNTNNGDGNKLITAPASDEGWLYWQHLALADLIEGVYTGIDGPTAPVHWDAVIGTNVPSGPRAGIGYSIYNPGGNTVFGSDANRNFMIVGLDNATDNVFTLGGAFSVEEMISFDAKVDDGVAHSGTVITRLGHANYNTVGCTSGAAPTFTYGTSSDTVKCNLIFDIEF